MKKSLTIIALAALVMLAGCKKNDPKPNGTRLFAGIEKHKSDSKTSLDGLQIKWSENDQLYVNNGTTSACFTLVSGAGTTKGEFATEGEYPFAAENNVAVYPYNYVSGLDNTTVTMTLPAVQAASGAGSFGNGANPMLGTFSDMDNLTLTSLCGVLCLQLTGNNVDITAIEIVGGPDDKLNGTFTVDYMNPEPTYPTEGTNTVRLNCNATLTSTAQKFYVVVPADTLHGLTMKVYNGDNEIFSKSTANNVPVFVNTLSTMDPVEVAPWYYYDNGVNVDAIGTGGGQFWWAVMFPAGSYEGHQVTKVMAYDYEAMTGTASIYQGGSNAPAGTALGQTNVTFTGSNQFLEFDFAAPVTVDPAQNLWVVFYNASGAAHPAAVCANTGDANGRWVSLDGTSWDDLAGFGLDYTFMLRAYIGDGAKGNYYGANETVSGMISNVFVISASDCTTAWLDGVAPTGTFTKASGATWPTGNNGIPSGWTVNEQ